MAILKPFKAWRPHPDFLKQVASVPYDVVNTQEARALAKGNPYSFLHVVRPEIDIPENSSIYNSKVYEQGRKNLEELLNSEAFLQEKDKSLYLYRLIMDGHSQTGIFGCVSVKDYENNIILKHELTRPDKEDDRTKHMITQRAYAEPVMLAFQDSGDISDYTKEFTQQHDPLYDMKTEDEVQHTIWKVDDSNPLVSAFSKIPKIYVADGHHRCASAARTAKEFASQSPEHNGEEAYNYFPAVLFPSDQMEILAYNRVIFSLPDNFLTQLKQQFDVQKNANPIPHKKGMISFYLNDNWYGITLDAPIKNDPASKLDISLLQKQILEPILGIKDQRTDSNIDFVGGIRGIQELERLVDNGEAELGISMYPTSIKELLDVSDAGQLMPPKSTWFEPKLRSGLLVHTF
jgi:uncharacterized protein (DUF1015 family)